MSKEKKRSSAWDNFYYEFFGRSPYEQWHDGINPDVVLDLKGEEREEAENLLIESLKQGGMWPTKGLMKMKSKKALPILKKELKKLGYNVLRIRIAEAIVEIEDSEEYISVIIDELLNNPSEYDRLEAAMVLRKYPSQKVVESLYKGVMDSEYLVRIHASESLLFIHGLEADLPRYREIFQYIVYDEEYTKRMKDKLDSELKGKDYDMVHAQAVKMLKDLFKDKEIKRRI